MRGVLGILFIGLGLLLAYFVLSGKFPTAATSTTTTTPSATPTPSTSNSVLNGGTQNAPGHGPTGSGPMGLPTMAYLDDLVASRGGIR
jgi:hypothetical protein